MIIFFGLRSTKLDSAPLMDEKCIYCNKKGSILITVIARYFHIFWIPIFSMGKRGRTTCYECGHEWKIVAMSKEQKYQFETLKIKSKVPKWQNLGLFLITFLVVIIGLLLIFDTEPPYIDDPQKDDVYIIKTEVGNYVGFMVVGVISDSLNVVSNLIETNNALEIFKVLGSKTYSDSAYWITKEELLKLDEEGRIVAITRE